MRLEEMLLSLGTKKLVSRERCLGYVGTYVMYSKVRSEALIGLVVRIEGLTGKAFFR